MKRWIQVATLLAFAGAILIAWALYPKFSNMKSEYGTAGAIGDIQDYLRENEGAWPSAPDQLDNRYPLNGRVLIDYSLTTEEILANPEILREAVRPRSGKFYTYPHYESDLEALLRTLRQGQAAKKTSEGGKG